MHSRRSEWLEDTETKLTTVFAGSNFYQIMAQAFQDVATFGTAPVIVYEDDDEIIRCYGPLRRRILLGRGRKADDRHAVTASSP